MRSDFFFLFSFFFLIIVNIKAQESSFQSPVKTTQKPWSGKQFENNPDNFQFAIVTDRTGGHRKGVFGKAVQRLNQLMPEFVMCVGDLIEGYTKDQQIINKQWAEFDSLLNPLAMRFFYLPGNHDISNEVMREDWLKRYGQSYYHFIYKDVLFLALDTNDGDASAEISEEQINYFTQVLEENKNVRWTMVFMHHPVWLYDKISGYESIEKLLKERPYTVYAGHYHQYIQSMRQDRNYYVLATTGGGSQLRGPRFGEFDHITWITMTEDGPRMLNLKLDGFVNNNISTTETLELAGALTKAAKFNSTTTYNEDKNGGQVLLSIENTGKDTIFFEGRFFHNHHLELDKSQLILKVAPESMAQSTVNWKALNDKPWQRTDPLEMDFTIGYHTQFLEHPFTLSGTYVVDKMIKEGQIKFTGLNVFTEEREVTLEHKFQDLDVYYTTDGSLPTPNALKYIQPIALSQTATIKAILVDPKTGSHTPVLEKTYRKVKTFEALKMKVSKPGLAYQYYEGDFKELPDFSAIQAVRSGQAMDFEVEVIAGDQRIDHYAIEYKGYIKIPEEGLYTFYTRSDDGSQLFIHDELVVDNNGSHSARWRSGHIPLKKGIHPIQIGYFEDYMGQTLQLFMKGPRDTERQAVKFDQLYIE